MNSKRYRFNEGRQPGQAQGPQRAIALGYDPGQDPAPRVLAAGQGALAERIIAVARENGIPIREDPVLTAALAQVDVDALIPPELYRLVAEVLAYLYRIQQKRMGETP